MSRERILVVAHGHPDFSLGGGELAAHQIFEHYRAHPAVEDAWFLGRLDRKDWPSGQISLRHPGEYLWDQAMHDWHRLTAVNRASLDAGFTDLILRLQPTIVHAHHYAHLGLEYLQKIKRLLPGVRIFLTLHEFMLICQHNGQMVKSGSLTLCDRATPQDCHRCYPEHSPESFWLRNEFIRDRLAVVDGFIAPSDFLRQRYVDWGIAPERIVTIENCLPERQPVPPRALVDGERRNRFAFFGQINPYKGLDVLLRALGELSETERREVHLEIHGAHFEQQSEALRNSVKALLEPLDGQGIVHWVGPYRPSQLAARMAEVDWVLMPSIWWENSPLVIQEAFGLGRPVICSNIGGMAEKVRHGVDGLHVAVGHPRAWARTMLECSRDDRLWPRLVAGIRRPPDGSAITEAHLHLFAGARVGV